MKLKALLLGSAAAMMSVSGFSTAATAADAVVAEPHPVEYVRVCDMYGAKWFYMPGTETCIQFDGYVRVTYAYSDWDIPQPNPRKAPELSYEPAPDVHTESRTSAARARIRRAVFFL